MWSPQPPNSKRFVAEAELQMKERERARDQKIHAQEISQGIQPSKKRIVLILLAVLLCIIIAIIVFRIFL